MRFLTLIALAGAVCAQDLTPRELFFSAPGSPVKVTRKAEAKPVTKQIDAVKASPAKPPTAPDRPNAQPGGATVIPALAVAPAPLGLRYSILLSRDNAAYKEVETESVFRSGDRLKIEVESNEGAYLYVVSRGSSGNWSVIFPTKEVDNGNNFIAPFRPYTVPNSGRFYFDDQAGEEKLFIVLSRKPESSFEDIIYTITTPTPQAKPQKEMQLAQTLRPIDDRFVGNVRNSMLARDLVFEKVDDSKPIAERKETAAYIINKNPAPDAKLIVDLSLKHK
ncbi:MAG: DUF4384 domain-containing protein [Acidobacteria bacterium]|nr:DUF4384 domain-containing protein [Acidobacteriota bacterium]